MKHSEIQNGKRVLRFRFCRFKYRTHSFLKGISAQAGEKNKGKKSPLLLTVT